MRVLVACEFSGMVRDAFLDRGHDAYSCDLRRGYWRPQHRGRHLQQDVRPLLRQAWDLVIAHPPCTYLCNSGVRWLTGNRERYAKMLDGCQFFLDCLLANAPRVCVENPIQHKYAREFITQSPTQIVRPYQFGDPETKATCLWLLGLPKLEPTDIVTGRVQRIAQMSLTPDRGAKRSVTCRGIALAMADQWGSLSVSPSGEVKGNSNGG